MSLLLDALKKAAEKNAQQESPTSDAGESTKYDATRIDQTSIDQAAIENKIVVDDTQLLTEENSPDNNVQPEVFDSEENITEMELAKIINAQKEKQPISQKDNNSENKNFAKQVNEVTEEEKQIFVDKTEEEPSFPELLIDDDTELKSDKEANDAINDLENDAFLTEDRSDLKSAELLNDDPDPSLSLFPEDEDPSLKLALSDEEIQLTDDDVTEFLGSDDFSMQLEDISITGGDSFLDDTTGLRLGDKTSSQSLNLVDPPSQFSSDDDTTYSPELTSNTADSTQSSNLNDLTNDVTIGLQDRTSTETFASDNYDRTLVRIEDDVSKVFTGMKSDKSGAAMTPDFAKKVFIHKSTSLRRQNYKIYGFISFILFLTIGVLALFEMQTQIDDIDTSLLRLKRNPVPSELRFKRQAEDVKNESILQGKVDIEALNLLKSLASKDEIGISQQESIVAEDAEIGEKNIETKEIVEITEKKGVIGKPNVDQPQLTESESVIPEEPSDLIAKVSQPQNVSAQEKKIVKAKKPAIKIETKTSISKESIWLTEAYKAFEKGDLELASMNYERVLNKDATNRDALLGQAAIYSGLNKNNQAISNYQAILLENPKDSLALTSLIAASQIDPVESESRLKVMHREAPNATHLQFALGNVISVQDRWQEAQQYYFMAYQSEPSNPDYAYNLAVSLEQINKPDVAINYYNQAVKNAQSMPSSFDVAIIKQRIEVLSQ